ncbi:hypothetical protein CR513_43105, partial [Mucuna pruriens]
MYVVGSHSFCVHHTLYVDKYLGIPCMICRNNKISLSTISRKVWKKITHEFSFAVVIRRGNSKNGEFILMGALKVSLKRHPMHNYHETN